jgi:hypothetical protein
MALLPKPAPDLARRRANTKAEAGRRRVAMGRMIDSLERFIHA